MIVQFIKYTFQNLFFEQIEIISLIVFDFSLWRRLVLTMKSIFGIMQLISGDCQKVPVFEIELKEPLYTSILKVGQVPEFNFS